MTSEALKVPSRRLPSLPLLFRVASRWALPHICGVFFVSPRDLQAPWADRRETLPSCRKVIVFDKLGPQILWAVPSKKVGAKNVQNLGRFWTTSKLIANIFEIEKRFHRQRFLTRSAKKSPVNFAPLTTPYYKHFLTHRNRLFRKTIFRPLGGAAGSNFYMC